VTDLSGFITEDNDAKALRFWLENFEDTTSLDTKEALLLALERHISEIDHLINDQLNIIIHHPRFQQLEASWRGLWYLVVCGDGVTNFKIKMLDITWKELSRDIDRALEFDQSQLFSKVYNEEYGIAGGEPYGVLIGDYEVSHKPSAKHTHDDIATLKGISEVAAAAFSPFIAGASSELFGLDSYSPLGNAPIDLHEVFRLHEYIPWRSLRNASDSRFIGLTMPHILMRQLYRTDPGIYKGVFFYEKHVDCNYGAFDRNNDPMPHDRRDMYLWGNASYAFGAMLIREFANVGWFGHIRGVPRNQEGGGLITNLPVDVFETDAYQIAARPSTDVIITDSMERDLSEHGFVPLCQCYDTPLCAFYSNQSIQKPPYQDAADARTVVNAKLSSMLQHILCGSRIAHYIKIMIRDKIGSFVSADDCENMLQKWLHKYTSGRKDLAWEEQARYPIAESRVSVKEHPEKAGRYLCSIRIVPHYQIDQMVSELELVTELAQSK